VKITLRETPGVNAGRLPILATLALLSLYACGGGGGSGGPPPTSNPTPTVAGLYPNCAPAGEQFIDGTDYQLTVITPSGSDLVAGSVVRWNGSDRPTTGTGGNAVIAEISASDIAAAGAATVTVFNPAPGGGTSNSATFTITAGAVDPQSIAIDPAGKFVYVVSGGCAGGVGSYVSMYTINPTTGFLASVGPPVWTHDYGVYPGSVAIASGKFVYVTNSGDYWDPDEGSVAMYTINAVTGALTYAGTIFGNCPGLCFPASMMVDPSGRFAYVVGGGFVASGGGGDASSNLAIYSIDAASGLLTSIGTFTAGTDPVAVAVDPAGKFAYLVNDNGAGSVSIYAINATTETLTSAATVAAGTDPVSIALDPSGRFAYVTNYGSDDVSMYTIDATTGALTSIGTIAAGTNPASIALDPSDKFAYVTNFGSNDLSMYTINSATGSLTSTGTVAAGLSPSSIAIDPSGRFAYVTGSGSNDVSTYSIGSSGTLTLITTTGT
jgi:YVTN family beta-propeller protein